MSDETQGPADQPGDETRTDAPTAPSVWSPPPAGPPGTESGGADADAVTSADRPEPADDAAAAPPPADAPEGTESGGADADVVTGADPASADPSDAAAEAGPATHAGADADQSSGADVGAAVPDASQGAPTTDAGTGDAGPPDAGDDAEAAPTAEASSDEAAASDPGASVEAAEEAPAAAGTETDADGGAAVDGGEGAPTSEAEADQASPPPTETADEAGAADGGEPATAGGDEATDTVEGEDSEARRAELEQEIDRQLAALEVDEEDHVDEDRDHDTAADDLGEDHEPDEEDGDEYEDGPVTAGDEADALVAQLDVDTGDEAETVPTAAVADEPTTEQPVRAGDEATDELTRIAAGAELAERSSRGPVVPLVVIAVLIAAVIAIVIAASGGDETDEAGGSTTSSVAGSPAVPVSPDLLPMPAAEALEYFEVYGTQDPTQLPRMIQLSAPDTPAGYYAIHQETLARIDPQRNAPLIVTLEGEEIEACPADPATGGCVTYGGFTKNEAGLLTHFTVNGTPLRDRMAIGTNNVVTANSMRVSIISRYISVSDRLFVAYTVSNDGATPITPVSVSYITPSGETLEPDNDTFRQPVQPGTSAVAAAAFPTTAAGGTLAVTSTSDGGNSQQLAQISTP